MENLESKMLVAGFWNNQLKAKETLKKSKEIKNILDPYNKTVKNLEDLEDIFYLAEEDSSLEEELGAELLDLEKIVSSLEISRLFCRPEDVNNTIVTIHSGAGGTEACDWAEMLFRMYSRWCERKNFKIEITDFQPGDEAGIKSVTFIASGPYAFGLLKVEIGVHRLVRISPFDANKRRHTSFASVDVIPEIEDDIEVEIREEDLRIDTYRASGAGGQHVNKTDSAVRITHVPSSIVVQCQENRSQHKNKAMAMKVLRARLYEKQLREKEEALAKKRGEKKKIEWGSQIRSYIFHPYSMVKDHRTGCETSNVNAVMDGDLEIFIDAGLKWMAS